MSCLCGDTECPTCGAVQGTLKPPTGWATRKLPHYPRGDERRRADIVFRTEIGVSLRRYRIARKFLDSFDPASKDRWRFRVRGEHYLAIAKALEDLDA